MASVRIAAIAFRGFPSTIASYSTTAVSDVVVPDVVVNRLKVPPILAGLEVERDADTLKELSPARSSSAPLRDPRCRCRST